MMHRAFVGKGDLIIQLDTDEQLHSKSILSKEVDFAASSGFQ